MPSPPGQLTPPPLSEGEHDIALMQAAQMSPSDISAEKNREIALQQQAGMRPDDIRKYWGDPPPSSPTVTNYVRGNLANMAAHDPQAAAQAHYSMWDYFKGGAQHSATGLVESGGRDTAVPLAGANFGQVAAFTTGQLIGDVPFSIAGGALGVAGGPAGAMAGAASLPEAARQTMLLAQRAHEIKPGDAPRVIGGSLSEVALAGASGYIGGAAAGPVAGAVLRAGAGKLVATAAGDLAAGGAQVTASSLGHGQLPTATDLALAGAAVIGAHAAGRVISPEHPEEAPATHHGNVAKQVADHVKVWGVQAANQDQGRVTSNVAQAWALTGRPPDQLVDIAKHDPIARQELMAQDSQGEAVLPHWHDASLNNPEMPFKPAPLAKPNLKSRLMSGTADITTPPAGAHYVASPDEALNLLYGEETSGTEAQRNVAVSPAGALGKGQVMLATARQYGFGAGLDDAALTAKLHDPEFNHQVSLTVVNDLWRRYQGNMDAIAIAYNAGPAHARDYLAAGPGARLERVDDPSVRGGRHYVQVKAAKDEAELPRETQQYLADLRARAHGPLSAQEGKGGEIVDEGARPDGAPIPSHDENELPESVADDAGEKVKSGSAGAASVWDTASLDDAEKSVLGSIGERPDPTWSAKSSLDATADYIWGLNPARRLGQQLIRNKLISEDELSPEDMWRQTLASESRANLWVTDHPLTSPQAKTFDEHTPGLMDATKAMKEDGGSPAGWLAYMMSKRHFDLEKREMESGVNPFAAKRVVDDVNADKKYARATKMWTDAFNGGLDYAVKSGRYSSAQAEAMKELNPVWLSFRRVMGDDKSFAVKSGYGFQLGNPLKRMEGSDKQIVNPFVSSLDNLRLVVQSADQNYARGQFLHMAATDPAIAAHLGLHKVGPVKPNDEQLDNVLKPYRKGLSEEEYEAMKDGLRPVRAASAEGQFNANEFGYYNDGMLEKWAVDDPNFAKMLRGATTIDELRPVLGIFQTFAAIQRTGVTLDPSFAVRTTISHQWVQWQNNPLHPPPFMAPIKGLMDVFKLSDVYKDAQAHGALVGGLVSQDKDFLATSIHELFGKTGADMLAKDGNVIGTNVRNAVLSPFQVSRWVQEHADATNRVGLYKMGLERGWTPDKAAMNARVGGIDYAEPLAQGWMRSLARATPFWKARMLYAKNFADYATAHPFQAAAMAAATVSLPTVINFAINTYMDQFLPPDQQYRNQPRWQKDYGLLLPQIGGQRILLRYPEGSGIVFGSVLERTLDAMWNHNPEAFRDWSGSIMEQLGGLAPVPAGLTPLAENAANHNFTTGRPMMSDRLKQQSTDIQFTDATTETAKRLSRIVTPYTDKLPWPLAPQFSPIGLDNIASNLGTAWRQLAMATGVPLGEHTDSWNELSDSPFGHMLFARHPGLSAQPIEDFYAEKAQFDKDKADMGAFKRLNAVGDRGYNDQANREQALAQADARLNGIASAINNARQAISAIERSDASDANKREHVENIWNHVIPLAQQGAAWARNIREKNGGQ